MLTALVIAARIVANPVSNVFQKKLVDGGARPAFVIAATHALLALAVAPFARAVPGAGFWLNMALCALLAVAGNVLLVYALRRTDLSILGPINAYKAVVGLGLGVVVLGEIPSAIGLAGVALIVAGSAFVMAESRGWPFLSGSRSAVAVRCVGVFGDGGRVSEAGSFAIVAGGGICVVVYFRAAGGGGDGKRQGRVTAGDGRRTCGWRSRRARCRRRLCSRSGRCRLAIPWRCSSYPV